jgi:hypothetical protein
MLLADSIEQPCLSGDGNTVLNLPCYTRDLQHIICIHMVRVVAMSSHIATKERKLPRVLTHCPSHQEADFK